MKKKKSKRTKTQYNQFRKAFKKWTAKYNIDEVEWVEIDKGKGSLQLYKTVDGHQVLITEYIAPDYVKYMEFIWRKYL